jgi:hypothetical protein
MNAKKGGQGASQKRGPELLFICVYVRSSAVQLRGEALADLAVSMMFHAKIPRTRQAANVVP